MVPDYTLSTDWNTEMLKEPKESQPGQHEDPRRSSAYKHS